MKLLVKRIDATTDSDALDEIGPAAYALALKVSAPGVTLSGSFRSI